VETTCQESRVDGEQLPVGPITYENNQENPSAQQFSLQMVKNKITVHKNSGSGSSSGLGEFWNEELAK
jgi:hypothetical protein